MKDDGVSKPGPRTYFAGFSSGLAVLTDVIVLVAVVFFWICAGVLGATLAAFALFTEPLTRRVMGAKKALPRSWRPVRS